jgi:hypothetical protein
VIVLDQQRVRVAVQYGAQLGEPAGGGRGAGRVLGAQRGDHRGGAALQRAIQRLRVEPVVVHRNRVEPKAERAGEVERGGVAGILDRHPVAGTQVRREDALHSVQRAVHHRDRPHRHALRPQQPGRQLAQLREHRVLAVQVVALVNGLQRAAELGQQRGVAVSRGQVAGAGRRRGRLHRQRWPAGDRGPAAAPRGDDASPAQPRVGGGDCRRAHAEVGGQPADRREPVAGREAPLAHRQLDAGGDLDRRGPDDAVDAHRPRF